MREINIRASNTPNMFDMLTKPSADVYIKQIKGAEGVPSNDGIAPRQEWSSISEVTSNKSRA